MRYRISSDVFYRLINKHVILYKTDTKKVSIYNCSANDILEFFKSPNQAEKCAQNIAKKYGLSNSEQEKIIAFIEQLAAAGVLIADNELTDDTGSVESYFRQSVLPPYVLYGALIELTFRCNEKCRYCYCVTEEQGELTTEEVKRILDELRAMNVLEVTFTGGDPFVRKDALELIEYAYSIGLLITVFTNGTAIMDSDFLRLKACHLKGIHFSIYSHIPEKHDKFTQVPGSFEKTTTAIKKCVLIGLPVNIKTTATEYNYDDLEGIISLARELGATVQIGMTVSAKNDGNTGPIRYRLDSIEKLVRVLEVVQNNVDSKCSDFVTSRNPKDSICLAGCNNISINPYGEVFPCNAYLLKCGSVRETSVKDIWENSETLKEIRNKRFIDIKGCENCPDLQYCNFCPGSALVETGDPLKRISEACNLARAYKIVKNL